MAILVRMSFFICMFWRVLRMNIKFAHAYLALDKLRDDVGSENLKDLTLEVTTTDDDPGSGKMVECLTMRCSVTSAPSKYDDLTTDSTSVYVIEVFADSENRAPRFTRTIVRDLERKNK